MKMEVSEASMKKELMKDYVKKFKTIFRILETTGYCRFVIRNEKMVARNQGTRLYNICVLLFANASAAYLLWFSNPTEQYLSLVEYIAIIYFTVFANLLMSNITFGDDNIGLNLMHNNIDIDTFLGVEETGFMRDVSLKLYVFILIVIGFTQVTVVAYMYYVFHVSIAIHVVGSIYFLWLFFAYDEFCFFIYLNSFIVMRIRYLNVAMIKFTKIKSEYVPKQTFFDILFWKNEYDDRITFHARSDMKNFCVALKMLFAQLRRIEDCYSFTIILGAATVAVGSLVAVQTFIMYIQTSETMIIRATAMLGWSGASWFHLLTTSMQTDLFFKEIEQLKLICAYVQLKPTSSEETLKLTKDILKTLEVRDAHMSVYGMFSFNTGLVLNIAASTFVYITVQLQLAFPNLKEPHKTANLTSPPAEFDFDPRKVKEFWFF